MIYSFIKSDNKTAIACYIILFSSYIFINKKCDL